MGTFLRSFAWGHALQLDAVSRHLLARAWGAGAGPGAQPLTIDLDSTIYEIYGLKKAGGSSFCYTHVRGLPPLLAVAAGTGEVLRARRRGGPAHTSRGVSRFIAQTVGFELSERVCAACLAVPQDAWLPALDSEGGPREGAWVAELDVELSAWPEGTRAICRRERPHPGAQLSFSDAEGHRFQVMLTNQKGSRIACLEQVHRRRAAIEDWGPLRQGLRAAQPALPLLRHERRLARARAHRHRPAVLDKEAAAHRHRSGHLRAQAPEVSPAARRRQDPASRPRREAAPAALLALGADPRRGLRGPASLTVRLTSSPPLHKTQGDHGAGFSTP